MIERNPNNFFEIAYEEGVGYQTALLLARASMSKETATEKLNEFCRVTTAICQTEEEKANAIESHKHCIVALNEVFDS